MGHFHKYIFHLAFTKISHSQAILIITSQGKRLLYLYFPRPETTKLFECEDIYTK